MDVCSLHTELRKEITDLTSAIGRIEGRQEMQLKGIDEIKNNVSNLYANGNAQKQELAVQKTKLTPLFWALTIIGSVVITSFVISLITKLH